MKRVRLMMLLMLFPIVVALLCYWWLQYFPNPMTWAKYISGKNSSADRIDQSGKFNQPVMMYFTPEFSTLPWCAWVHSAGQISVSPFLGCTSIP